MDCDISQKDNFPIRLTLANLILHPLWSQLEAIYVVRVSSLIPMVEPDLQLLRVTTSVVFTTAFGLYLVPCTAAITLLENFF